MATQAVLPQRQSEFQQVIRSWDRRLRAQQSLVWLPRALWPGLVLGIVLAIVSRLRPWLLSGQILMATAITLVVVLLAMMLLVWLWQRSPLASARQFDVQFGLKERMSAALELMDGRITSHEEITSRQLDDAWNKAGFVKLSEDLPLIWHGREWMFGVLMAALLAVLLILPNPQAAAVEQASDTQAAIDAAAEEVKDIIPDVAADSELDEAEREQLLQTLETSLDTLESPEITPEEAFAALSSAETALQEQADQLNQQLDAQNAALQQAADQLRQASSAEPQNAGQGDSAQEISDMLNQMAQQIENMDASQRQAAQNALEQAAQDLQSVSPQAAQQMQQAAQQMQQGNNSAAQSSMQQASQQMQQTSQGQQAQQNSAQQMQQSANQAQQAASQVAQQSQQQGQPQNQQGQQGQQSQQSQQGQSSQQQGQGSQQGQQGNQPGQEGAQPSSGQQGGQQSGQQSQQGSGSEGQQGNQSSQSPSSGTGGGAGDQEGGPSESGGQQSSGPIETNNNPDGQGVDPSAELFDPRRLNQQGDDTVVLEPDASDMPVAEGDFAENAPGDVTVPYQELFSDYRDDANQALESDYIPLGMRDVVRDYFSSLEPGQSNSGNNAP